MEKGTVESPSTTVANFTYKHNILPNKSSNNFIENYLNNLGIKTHFIL